MAESPTVVDIVDSPTLKRIRSSCGCVFTFDANEGVSLYFCHDHTDPSLKGEGGVVYDGDAPALQPAFGWDYKVWPGLPIT